MVEQLLFESYISILYTNVNAFTEPPPFSTELALLIYIYFAEVLESNNKYEISVGIYDTALCCIKLHNDTDKVYIYIYILQ